MSNVCIALNASYEPLTQMSVPRALRLVLQGKAEILEGDATRPIVSEKQTIPRPLVIRLKKFVVVPKRFRKKVTNQFLFARDSYTCQYCGKHERELKRGRGLTRDHIVPRVRGGTDEWTNVTTACSSCNGRKADKAPAEVGLTLRSVPKVPNLVELKWEVRRLTPLQRKYVTMFYGSDVAGALE